MEVKRSHSLRWITVLAIVIGAASVEDFDGIKFQEQFYQNNSFLFGNTSNGRRMPMVLAMSGMAGAMALGTKNVSNALQEAAAEELGLAPLRELLTTAKPVGPYLTDDDFLFAAAERLSAKLNSATKTMFEIKQFVMNDSYMGSFTHPCPLNSVKKSTYIRDVEKNEDKLTLNLSKSKYNSAKRRIASSKFADDSNDLKIKRQYFMAVSDGATDKDCRLLSDDSRLRGLFHNIFQPSVKQVVIIIDNGKDTNQNELRVAQSIAIETINILKKTDKVGILTAQHAFDDLHLLKSCPENISNVDSASEDYKEFLFKSITALEVSDDELNITSLIYAALKMFTPQQNNAMIIYIGADSHWINRIENVEYLEDYVSEYLKYTVVLNTCDVLSTDNINYDGTPYLLPNCDEAKDNITLCKGVNINFNSSFTIGQMSSLFLLSLSKGSIGESVVAAPPVWDPVQRDLLIPLTLLCEDRGLIIMDLYLAELAQDIIYFDSFSYNRRAFLIDFAGNVIMHSSYVRPEVIVNKPKLVDISMLESNSQFDTVRPAFFVSNGTKIIDDGDKKTVYMWRWVKKLYIICIVTELDAKYSNVTKYRWLANRSIRELQYHRIDLLPPSSGAVCRHFKQVSTIERGTLYLSPSSFQSPFRYLHDIKSGQDISFKVLQSCMAYLKDGTRLLSNPGLKSEVRNDVGLLYPMLTFFKRQQIKGSYNKYIVRRYAATEHGVLVMFPGSILESDYEPNRKAWFTKAMQNPGKFILTPPYLDAGGAGYIVTVSYAPQHPLNNSKPTLVVSMDMTMGFLYKILSGSLRLCMLPNIKCFMMDEQGYLLSHPSLFDRRAAGPIEQQHITHKESFIANDMLYHKGFVQKELCTNFVDGTLQRYYKFNISLASVLTNFIHGEQCPRYYITSIQGTNTFLGMVNSTYEAGAFCPCSVIDRVCLNCNRMEQNECECPCECSMPETSSCGATSPIAPICDLQPERNNHKNHFFYNLATHLKSCFDFQCDSYRTESACLGVLGCEWCHIDLDGDSSLVTPFCSAQSACFGGVIGAVTPYGEGSMGHVMQDDLLATYSAVGPIAGCIVAVCLILAIAVYCYKQNLTGNNSGDAYLGPPPDPWPDAGVQMSHLASEDDIHDERSGHQDKLLLANDLVVPISPYRVLTGYRRPNTTGESDHGYSTMTPHDDSEHLAFALVEPFMSADVSTSGELSSSPAIPSRLTITDPVTILPCGKNNVIAPVTVHRHMEAS